MLLAAGIAESDARCVDRDPLSSVAGSMTGGDLARFRAEVRMRLPQGSHAEEARSDEQTCVKDLETAALLVPKKKPVPSGERAKMGGRAPA